MMPYFMYGFKFENKMLMTNIEIVNNLLTEIEEFSLTLK